MEKAYIEIDSIRFSGKRSIPWNEVELLLSKYTGNVIEVDELWESSHNSSYGKKNVMGSNAVK